MPKDKESWVIYKEIKDKVTMEMVLDRYGLRDKLKRSGKNLVVLFSTILRNGIYRARRHG